MTWAPSSGPAILVDIGPMAYRDSADAGNELGCTDAGGGSPGGGFAAGDFVGKIALISRGFCAYREKVNNAAAAGAVAVVIFNNARGIATMSVPGTAIPSVSISQDDGAGDPGLTIAPVSVSLGAQYPGYLASVPLALKNVSPRSFTWRVSVEPGAAGAGLTVVPAAARFPLRARTARTLRVAFRIGDAAPPGDYWGQILLQTTNGRYRERVRYWVRVLPAPALRAADVLLLDDDGSDSEGTADYRSTSTAALDELGVGYEVLEVSHTTCASPWLVAARYPRAVLFSGDSRGYFWNCDFVGYPLVNQSGAHLYLAGGGRLLMTGQHIPGSIDSFRPSELAVWFGASPGNADLYGDLALPTPTAVGAPAAPSFLAGVQVDLGGSGDGAHNQASVQEIDAIAAPDVDAVNAIASIGGTPVGGGDVGVCLSSEPTIERVRRTPRTLWTTVGYRTATLGFGVEGMNDDTGHTTRAALLGKFLDWLADSVTITRMRGPGFARRGRSVPCSAVARLGVPAGNSVQQYRWDFGDGTPPVAGASAAATHTFATPGRYTVRVEATDSFGHKAVRGRRIRMTR